MTKREMFELISRVCSDNAEIVDFCNHEIELLNHKASQTRKPSKNQVANIAYKEAILDILAETDRPLTISEIQTFPEMSELKNQRVSALVTQLKNEGKVIRTEIKRKAYFELAEAE